MRNERGHAWVMHRSKATEPTKSPTGTTMYMRVSRFDGWMPSERSNSRELSSLRRLARICKFWDSESD